MNKKLFLALLLIPLTVMMGCKKDQDAEPVDPQKQDTTHINPDPAPFVPAPVGSYAKGADVSWITELEQYPYGKSFKDVDGTKTELMQLLRNNGCNSIRLRVWVDPSVEQNGYCDKADVIKKAKRAADLGLRVMIDFHYSDTWCDPGNQAIPASWANKSIDEVCTLLATYTKDVLQGIKDAGITPEWVQVGNETHTGMCWPLGEINTQTGDQTIAWANYGRLVGTGYDAVKEVLPEAIVIVHFANAYKDYSGLYQKLKDNGGKWDMIGLSHYPMNIKNVGWANANTYARNNIKKYHETFNCDVMLVEFGTKADDDNAKNVVTDLRSKIDDLSYMKGIFYWEPEIYWYGSATSGWYWHGYEMGAFTKNAQPNDALLQLWK